MKTTEQSSNYNNLESMAVGDVLRGINAEDSTITQAIAAKIPAIEAFVAALVERMKRGGRLFYIGAGTSGRLGILDASECPPTYGVPHDLVIGLIAGGDSAIRKAVEHAEDDFHGAWRDLSNYSPTPDDTLVGIAASGSTPYVVGGLNAAREAGMLTACITCNEGSACADAAEHPIEVVVGPEFVTGSTRMKAGTAQKLILNMITTATMIQLGHVKGNKMIDMQLSNDKLQGRAEGMVMEALQVSREVAQSLLEKNHSVRAAIAAYPKK